MKSMVYTVKKLSEISGVTVRTLHFYEEAGLLKPAYYGANGYRYYEEKELLQLQQILFFKELGFTLKQIRKVVGKGDFDQIAALYSHRVALTNEWKKIGRLLKTIDKTIEHLKGKKKMQERKFFDGFFLVKKGRGDESYFAAEEIMLQNLKRKPTDTLTDSEALEVAKTGNQIYGRLADCLEKGMAPSSKAVQKLILEHSELALKFHEMTKRSYKALATLYSEHPEYRKQLDGIHPDLAVFMAEAMALFADKNLS
jgi:MerR family transcriptional regulator, thiopeptide resistance regulator